MPIAALALMIGEKAADSHSTGTGSLSQGLQDWQLELTKPEAWLRLTKTGDAYCSRAWLGITTVVKSRLRSLT